MKLMMKALITLLVVAGVCMAAEETHESDAPAFQAWQRLLNEAAQAVAISSEQDPEEARLKLLAALDLAKGLTPLEEAKTLEQLAQLLRSDQTDQAFELLNRSYDLKVADGGPRSAEVADTLMLIGQVQEAEQMYAMAARRNAGKDTTDLETSESRSRATRLQALEIRREVFGVNSCEVGEVQLLLALQDERTGNPDLTEKMYREILTYCPPPKDAEGNLDMSRDSTGFGALSCLMELLQRQGRDSEVEQLEEEYGL